MRIHIPAELAFGSCPGSMQPPQLCGAFIIKATFRLASGQLTWADEPDLVVGDMHEDGDSSHPLVYASDFALFKPRTDFIVVGKARPPAGTAVQKLRTGISVGSFAKVFDARSDAGPFTALPLAHRWVAEPPPLPRRRNRLPAPELVGFGPVPAGWPQRQDLTGTYDERYMRERWPWFPEDFDYGYFNAAPRDQQLDGYLRGDEDVVLQHLHPELPMLRTKLPGLRVRCFLQMRRSDGALAYREPRMQLDTLFIDVEAKKVNLVWRGISEVRTPKMSDVEQVVVVTEPLSEQPRPASTYAAAFVEAPKPRDEAAAVEAKAAALTFAQLELDMAAMSQRMAGMDAEFAAAEKEIEAAAASVAAELPPGNELPTKDVAPMPASAAAAEIRAALAQLVEQDPTLAATVADVDADVDAFAALEAEFAAMTQAWAAFDAEMKPDLWTRERVAAAAAANTPMTDLDLGGLDLGGLDLSRQDLSGSRLVGARLEGTRLAGAKLVGSDLTGCQLAEADLSDAVLDGADLSDAVLHGATLLRLSLHRTRLAGVDLAGTDLTGSKGKETNFAGADLSGACLAGVRLPAADFSASRLDQSDFRGAELSRASFSEAVAPRVDFTGALLDGLQAEAANFTGGCFRQVVGRGAVFDAAKLDGADLGRATFVDAQFATASLRGADLNRADLTAAMFDDAGLQGAVLSHAKLLRTSFEGADLTGARADGAHGHETGFWRAVGAADAFRGATLTSTLLR